jgi:hypothetical protein
MTKIQSNEDYSLFLDKNDRLNEHTLSLYCVPDAHDLNQISKFGTIPDTDLGRRR